MQRASKRAPQWLRDLGVFILVMGGAVGVCMLLSACYDDNTVKIVDNLVIYGLLNWVEKR